MNLTHDYRTVRAIFEEPEDEPHYWEDPHDEGVYKSHFQVGPVIYYVKLSHYGHICLVSFGYQDMVGTTEFLTKYLSGIFKREVTSIELDDLKNRFERNKSGILKLGNASSVFGNVLAIVRDFVNKHDISCLRFTSIQESRTDLYRAMIKRFAPSWKLEEDNSGSATRFSICKPEESYEEKKLKYSMTF
jgi:hypothetical protein